MKQIKLLLLALILSVSVQAQTIDTALSTATGITSAKIQPITISVWDTTTAKAVGVSIVSDNLYNRCMLYYQLVDSLGNILYSGNISVTDTDYANWNGNNSYPFVYVASKLKLTLK